MSLHAVETPGPACWRLPELVTLTPSPRLTVVEVDQRYSESDELLPAPGGALLRAVCEVLMQRRPAVQLRDYTHEETVEQLQELSSDSIQHLRVMRVQYARGVAEIALRMVRGGRTQAVALQLRYGDGWRLTCVETASTPPWERGRRHR